MPPPTGFIRELNEVEKYKLFLFNELGGDYKTYRLLNRVINCESNFRQYWKNGEVLIVKGNVGLAQINRLAHQKTWEAMGLNVYEPYDNLRFMIFLYKRDSVHPWLKWSGKCFLE